MTEDAIAKEIVDVAFRMHTVLGPGLFESVYEAILASELQKRGCASQGSNRYPWFTKGLGSKWVFAPI